MIKAMISNVKFRGYHEPFLGGGAVFLGLTTTGAINLSDSNAELIETYEQIKRSPRKVSALLESYVNDKDSYYLARAEKPRSAAARAARFIYLNHTSFNGIYRVNLEGTYNVPYGNRQNTNMPDTALLEAISARLQKATLSVCDFSVATQSVRARDLVFLDPPYTVAHNHNGFVKYNRNLFSFEDQMRLSKAIDTIRAKKAYYILTNAAHESIAQLFDKGDLRFDTQRKNAVGGKLATRGLADEYLFTNVPIDV